MAKQRRQNSVVDAISAVTAALKLESIPNPTEEQKQQIHDAKVQAADVIENSTMMTMGEYAQDDVMARIEAEEQAEAEEQGRELAEDEIG